MKKSEVPVLVVGAGAAGTMSTLELARRGVRVRTIDRLPRPALTSRAIIIHARTAEILERIDERLIERFLDRGIEAPGYALHFVEADGRRSELRPGLDFTTLDSRYPFVLLHRQSETEQYLREYTGAHFGVSPDWNTTCEDVQQDTDGVTAILDNGGVREEVRCQYLVACDGEGSRVRDVIVGPQQGAAAGTLALLDAYLDGFPDGDDYIHHCLGPGYSLTIAKVPGDFHRLVLDERSASSASASDADSFLRFVDRHFDGVSLGDVVWQSQWQARERNASTYRRGRVLFAGEAAHSYASAGGQGLNCCLQDAYNLGWKLAFVVKKLAKATLLDSYEVERRQSAEQMSAAASSLKQILEGSAGPDAGSAMMTDREVRDAVVARCSGIAFAYDDDKAMQHEALVPVEGPAPGSRAPDADLGGGHTLFERTRHPRCALLGLPATESSAGRLALELKPLAHRFKSVLELHVVPPSLGLTRRYGTGAHDRLFLLRPDGYVAFRGLAAEVKRLEAHLSGWFAL